MSNNTHILLFDGVCNLCNSAVRFVIKNDHQKRFRFASLQSDAGKRLLQSVGLPENHIHSIVYITGNNVYIKSDAALKAACQLKPPVKLLVILLIVPKFIRDAMYNWVAKNRYRWFGKKETCMIPTTELKSRFIE